MPRLHLAYRLAGRASCSVLAPTRSRRRALLAAGFALYDVVGAMWMSQYEDPPLFAGRVGADLLDMMLWAALQDEGFANVVMVGNVTSAEAGLRYGGPREHGPCKRERRCLLPGDLPPGDHRCGLEDGDHQPRAAVA